MPFRLRQRPGSPAATSNPCAVQNLFLLIAAVMVILLFGSLHAQTRVKIEPKINLNAPTLICAHRGVDASIAISEFQELSLVPRFQRLCVRYQICCADYDIIRSVEGTLWIGHPADVAKSIAANRTGSTLEQAITAVVAGKVTHAELEHTPGTVTAPLREFLIMVGALMNASSAARSYMSLSLEAKMAAVNIRDAVSAVLSEVDKVLDGPATAALLKRTQFITEQEKTTLQDLQAIDVLTAGKGLPPIQFMVPVREKSTGGLAMCSSLASPPAWATTMAPSLQLLEKCGNAGRRIEHNMPIAVWLVDSAVEVQSITAMRKRGLPIERLISNRPTFVRSQLSAPR